MVKLYITAVFFTLIASKALACWDFSFNQYKRTGCSNNGCQPYNSDGPVHVSVRTMANGCILSFYTKTGCLPDNSIDDYLDPGEFDPDVGDNTRFSFEVADCT
jgi:hypothetical protein